MLSRYCNFLGHVSGVVTRCRNIITLTRKHPIEAPSREWDAGIIPKLKVEQQIYEVTVKDEVDHTLEVLLTSDVPGLGTTGTVVKIHRNRFWRYLYPLQLAELPTKDRVKYFRSLSKNSGRPILCGDAYESEQRLRNMTLYIPMNPAVDWQLNPKHVKIAFRRYGFVVDEESITLPSQPVTRNSSASPFTISVKIDHVVDVPVSCRIFLYQKLDNFTCTQPPTDAVDLSPSNQAALVHFDRYYTQSYGPIAWCAMRVALLSPPTKVAVLNRAFETFTDENEDYARRGRLDLVKTLSGYQSLLSQSGSTATSNTDLDEEATVADEPAAPHSPRQFIGRADNSIPETVNLTEFVPVTEFIGESEIFTRECDRDVAFVPTDLRTNTNCGTRWELVDEDWNLPDALRVKCPKYGKLGGYHKPTFANGQFDFYPIDLGSVLVVLALNLNPGDTLLDLCAAPGGKTVTALQTLKPRRLVCVDNSLSRLQRLQHVLNTHGLVDAPSGPKVDVVHESSFNNFIKSALPVEERLFDKVLVDVPCSSDRHALTSDEGSLFSRGKSKARANLPELQSMLLRRGMSFCRVGGSVVYSTCTLSPAQNQAVIELCLDRVNSSENGARFALSNVFPLIRWFELAQRDLGLRLVPVFASQSATEPVGMLVAPVLSANYGPTFICKLKRIC
ncbi:5-methylcytosine rRNA methyltransferase nsun4 [Clonorchis sinensis]|uniref:NOL1/NOP2/Sun domain family member 4 n=1 Tax=Clonorchis sinensis TaxID=79923 RepID=A0A8T1M8Q4_CLOSI|nr:5-methylcytosine rRNA methyltransferase nsun4 [Clonorchis sinensis]